MKIPNSFLVVAVAASIWLSQPILAQQNEAVSLAVKAGVQTNRQFTMVFDFIRASKEENQWRSVPWIPDLWEGIQISARTQKPMFIWAMNGDPLGCV
ncbi:MAG: hypothetical protein AAF623_09795 [Planctomycetota bacterium]